MSAKVLADIKRVICQNFAKSVSRPRVTLPKATTFNEIVTLYLKMFRPKHVL